MATVEREPTISRTLADLMRRLGDVPLERVRLHPALGTATVQDVIEIEAKEDKLCELIDGVLVEKVMGYPESVLALHIGTLLNNFVLPRKLGLVAGSDGMLQLFPELVRIPDVSFVKWDRVPKGRSRIDPVPLFSPNLAVEVLSKGNTKAEMKGKRHDYFGSGTEIVWEVDQRKETVVVFTSPLKSKTLVMGETLTGEPVLPGFSVTLEELFTAWERLD